MSMRNVGKDKQRVTKMKVEYGDLERIQKKEEKIELSTAVGK